MLLDKQTILNMSGFVPVYTFFTSPTARIGNKNNTRTFLIGYELLVDSCLSYIKHTSVDEINEPGSRWDLPFLYSYLYPGLGISSGVLSVYFLENSTFTSYVSFFIFQRKGQTDYSQIFEEFPFVFLTGSFLSGETNSNTNSCVGGRTKVKVFSGGILRNTDHHKAFMETRHALLVFTGPSACMWSILVQ